MIKFPSTPAVTALLCVFLWIASSHQSVAGAPPVITAQPQPQTSFIGANVNLRVSVATSSGVRYQWRFHGINLPDDFPGQFTPLLALREVTTDASGPYSVVVSNSFGTVTSQTAIVTVNRFTGFVVGYVNLSANPGFSLFSTALAQFDTNQTVAQQIPFAPDGASLFKLDGNGFIANNFLDGWSDTEMNMTLGEGWFLHNPTTSPYTLTLVGAVVEGRVVNRLPEGHSLCANIIPQPGLLTSFLSFPATPGAKVFRFDNPSQDYLVHEADGAGWFPYEPGVTVSEAFWLQEPADLDWVRYFSVFLRETPSTSYLIVQPALTSETGEINFFTYHPDATLGRVLDFDHGTPLNSEFAAQLYAGTNDVESSLAPIGRPQLFLDGAGAGYIRSATVKLPGVRGGQTVHLQLRVWEKCAGHTYEQAVFNGSASGRSSVFTTIARATVENGEPGLPPRNANTFPTFSISVGQEVPLRLGRVFTTGGTVEVCGPVEHSTFLRNKFRAPTASIRLKV